MSKSELIRGALAQGPLPAHTPKNQVTSGSCEAEELLSREAGADAYGVSAPIKKLLVHCSESVFIGVTV